MHDSTVLFSPKVTHCSTRRLEIPLTEIVSLFLHRVTSSYYDLPPEEIQVAELVKDGNMTKEIADFL